MHHQGQFDYGDYLSSVMCVGLTAVKVNDGRRQKTSHNVGCEIVMMTLFDLFFFFTHFDSDRSGRYAHHAHRHTKTICAGNFTALHTEVDWSYETFNKQMYR